MAAMEEAAETAPSPPPPIEDSFTVHEKLVAYVHAINSDPEPRSGVWSEHSYARPVSGTSTGSHSMHGATRTLLVRRPRYTLHEPPHPAMLDVESCELDGPLPPDPPPEIVDEPDMEEDDWEEKMLATAPSVLMKRAMAKVAAVLKSLRLSRLCGAGGKRDETRSHARLLRRALAPLWLPLDGCVPASWLHATLLATLPPHYRVLLHELLSELTRSVPQLCARLGGKLPAPASDPYPRLGPAVMPTSSRVLLVWIGSGRERTDARWTRRFRPLLPTHYIRIHNGPAASPALWTHGALSTLRRALATLSLARDSCCGVCVGGAGAGGVLAALLAAGDGRVKAVLQLAPPVLTAEGPPPPRAPAVPSLAVLPADCCSAWWGRGGGGSVLAVGGVDSQLRAPRARRRHLRLPQHALDAALADECARWLHETLEGGESDNSEDTTSNTTSIGMEIEDDEFAHLPSLINEKPPPPPSNCSIEISEGRVISRCAGGIPLALFPPRRPQPPATPGTPAGGHDIMSLPVVLADDTQGLIPVNNNHVSIEKKHPTVTVKSGDPPRYTKVIVAKRSAAQGGPIVIQSEVRLSPAGPR